MKKPILSLVLVGLSALSAVAQSPTFVLTPITGLPSTLAAVTQTNFPIATAPFIYVAKQDFVTFEMTGVVSAEPTNIIWILAPTVSGINFNTNLTTAGVTTASQVSNVLTMTFTNDLAQRTWTMTVPTYGIMGYKLLSIYNKSASGTYTNLGAYYAQKISTP